MTHYAKCRAAGRCISCPNEEKQHARCTECRERYRDRHKQQKEFGICPDCGNPNDNGKSRCDNCLGQKVELYAERKAAGQCPHCGSDKPIEPGKHCKRCRKINRKKDRAKNRKLRKQVIEAYGGKCTCCSETEEAFLCVDHVENDGHKHRRELFGTNACGSTRFYTWLRKQGFPKKGFQMLCANCNYAKARYGRCPHQN